MAASIDPFAELAAQLLAALKEDTGLAAAFPSGKAKVFDLPPSNQQMPYVCFDDAHIESQAGQGFDGSEANLSLHVWSRPAAPGMQEARTLAAAAVDAVVNAGLIMDNFRMVQARWVDSRPLLQPDGQTVHIVVRFAISADPA